MRDARRAEHGPCRAMPDLPGHAFARTDLAGAPFAFENFPAVLRPNDSSSVSVVSSMAAVPSKSHREWSSRTTSFPVIEITARNSDSAGR